MSKRKWRRGGRISKKRYWALNTSTHTCPHTSISINLNLKFRQFFFFFFIFLPSSCIKYHLNCIQRKEEIFNECLGWKKAKKNSETKTKRNQNSEPKIASRSNDNWTTETNFLPISLLPSKKKLKEICIFTFHSNVDSAKKLLNKEYWNY